jgi:alanyl-tRNA synthetase
MKSAQIRQAFLDFFASKGHTMVSQQLAGSA